MVPEFHDVEPHKIFANLVTDAVLCYLECVEMKGVGDYNLVVTLVDGVEPWVRVIDNNSRQIWLVKNLIKLARYLLVDPVIFRAASRA
nr:hypothetical protein [Tanacetum cinerariifolium]